MARTISFSCRIGRSLASVALTVLCAVAATAQEKRVQFDIPAQAVGTALAAYARQANVEFMIPGSEIAGVTANAVRGEYETRQALELLLQGTGLEAKFTEDGGVQIIRSASATSRARDAANRPASDPSDETVRLSQADTAAEAPTSGGPKQEAALDEIIVTGTHIRGVQPASPMVTITQEQMRLSGHTNLGQVIRALPQNFGGGQNPEVQGTGGLGGLSNVNDTGGSSLNLRGLGPDATLTLLNGARLPYDGERQATDISVIPVAAIDRIEVLLDGASAVYGSDAVGGVANLVLKRDYEGAELSARYGASTAGGNGQTQFTALAGTTWSSGGFLVTGDLSRNTPIRARDRDYLRAMPARTMIFPDLTQKSGLLSGHQQMGNVELTLDAFYTDQEMDNFTEEFAIFSRHDDSAIYGISPALKLSLPGEWSSRLHGFLGRDEDEYVNRAFDIGTGTLLLETRFCNCNKSEEIGVNADGPLFDLAGQSVRLSVGAGYRKSNFENTNLITGLTLIRGDARSRYGYGEINLPLVSADRQIPGIVRLSLNGAVRYEDYDSFGNVTTPKLGVSWSVTPTLDFKASWGKSFKVPTLTQQFADRLATLRPASLFTTGAPAGATVLVASGANPLLDPERAEVITAGFAIHPQFLPRLRLELGWFDIDYTDRVVTPISPFTQALSNSIYAEFVDLSPSVAEQNALIAGATLFRNSSGGAYDPANVIAIVDNGNTNASRQAVNGVDLAVNYTADAFGGSLTVDLNSSWLDGERRLTALSPTVDTTGIAFFPVKFRGRGGISWARKGLVLSSYLNYIDGEENPNVIPSASISSMTTLDLIADYQWESSVIGDTRFNIAVSNLFNERPPFMQAVFPFTVNYDSTNYSAVGRVVSVTITKQF